MRKFSPVEITYLGVLVLLWSGVMIGITAILVSDRGGVVKGNGDAFYIALCMTDLILVGLGGALTVAGAAAHANPVRAVMLLRTAARVMQAYGAVGFAALVTVVWVRTRQLTPTLTTGFVSVVLLMIWLLVIRTAAEYWQRQIET